MFSLNDMADELVLDDLFQSRNDHSDDFDDDSEPSDTGCEYAIVNGQKSIIPYELYELPSLKEILSLETWNLYLTDEERFHLSAYLPDMDQEIFDLTMIELLNGGNFFFGSPLEALLHRLKSGFYSLQVTHFREGLKFLQERLFYHSLRSYHENIYQNFVNMRKVWRNCQPNTSVTERIQIWKNKIVHKPTVLVDLNAFPLDEKLSCKRDGRIMGFSQVRRAYMDEKVVAQVPVINQNDTTMNNKLKAKGVLKIKLSTTSSTLKQDIRSLPIESLQPFRWPPKGVLKIKPKICPTNPVESSNTTVAPHDQSSACVFGPHALKFSPSHSTSYWQEENITKNLNCVRKLARFQSNYRECTIPKLTIDRQSDDTLNTSSKGILRKKKTIKHLKIASDDFSSFRERFDGQQKRALRPLSNGLHKSVSDNSQRKLMTFHTNVSETLSSNLISANDYQILPTYSGHSVLLYGDEDGDSVEKGHLFPLSYKRKKPHSRCSPLQSQKMP